MRWRISCLAFLHGLNLLDLSQYARYGWNHLLLHIIDAITQLWRTFWTIPAKKIAWQNKTLVNEVAYQMKFSHNFFFVKIDGRKKLFHASSQKNPRTFLLDVTVLNFNWQPFQEFLLHSIFLSSSFTSLLLRSVFFKYYFLVPRVNEVSYSVVWQCCVCFRGWKG